MCGPAFTRAMRVGDIRRCTSSDLNRRCVRAERTRHALLSGIEVTRRARTTFRELLNEQEVSFQGRPTFSGRPGSLFPSRCCNRRFLVRRGGKIFKTGRLRPPQRGNPLSAQGNGLGMCTSRQTKPCQGGPKPWLAIPCVWPIDDGSLTLGPPRWGWTVFTGGRFPGRWPGLTAVSKVLKSPCL